MTEPEARVANQVLGSTLDGSGGDDARWGSALADVFRGGTGNDVIYSSGGADRSIFEAPGWGHDVIRGWGTVQLLDLRGSGLDFASPAIQAGPGFALVTAGADTIQVFGAGGLLATDFLFG